MSKMTTREYKNIAKRPSKRGHGLAVRRSAVELDVVAEAEADLTELQEQDIANDEAEQDLAIELDQEAEAEAPAVKFEQPMALGSIDG